ncbi:MAG TPA: trehalose-phosphatase [Candidatus Sulfotelmatobacter sp.]|jgi:trehalose 6-phosphate phosphatase|nr:trehalose-phosphatase [Candidatus Sulfotelmatobacter sp.]
MFLDIDGTLLDLAPRPDQVVVPDGLLVLLDALSIRLSGAMALISGRSLADIDRLLPGGRDAAGTHGAEWRLSGISPAPRRQDWLDAAIADIRAEIRSLPGILMETKPCSVALHFQPVPEHEPAVLALLDRIAGDSSVPLRVLRGKAMAELIPVGQNKGRAIERFMRFSPYAERLPVFIGDDVTDEDGFDAVDRMGGVSIRVGALSGEKTLNLPSSAAVRHWLAGLGHSLGGMVAQ